LSSRRLLPLVLVALFGACEIENIAVPQTQARVAMHAVLSATAPVQVLLLERTRTGAVDVTGPPFEIEDPFGSDPGVAEPNATVRLTTPSGVTIVGREDLSPGGSGAGIYRFSLPGEFLERNGTYQLSVVTFQGELLTAETTVPGGAVAAFAEQRVFDRAQDSVVIEWPAAPGARSYFVRIETPFGPRSFFTDSTRVRLTGELRNADVTSLPHVFIPGFPQAVTVSAVDSNFYDWYRTHNAELSGTGLINRVQGGLGVFGSLVRLRYQDLRVVAPQREPMEGTFKFVGTPEELISTPYLSLELYVESHAARSDQTDALSGRYDRQMRLGDIGCGTCGLLGAARNGRVELAFLREWVASDTTEMLIGELHGDTIVGTYRARGGVARFVRQP
jgi:hypothetical protein